MKRQLPRSDTIPLIFIGLTRLLIVIFWAASARAWGS
jgi:hypothetical protein